MSISPPFWLEPADCARTPEYKKALEKTFKFGQDHWVQTVRLALYTDAGARNFMREMARRQAAEIPFTKENPIRYEPNTHVNSAGYGRKRNPVSPKRKRPGNRRPR